MDRPPSLLELIALRLSPAESDSDSFRMATLISPTLAVSAFTAGADWGRRPQLLQFALWPEPFETPGMLVALDNDTGLLVFEFKSALLPGQVPPIKFAPRARFSRDEKWESILLGRAGSNANLTLTGRTWGIKGSIVTLYCESGPPSLHGMEGAPVLVGNELIGIVSAYRKEQGSWLLQAISVEAIHQFMSAPIERARQARAKQRAAQLGKEYVEGGEQFDEQQERELNARILNEPAPQFSDGSKEMPSGSSTVDVADPATIAAPSSPPHVSTPPPVNAPPAAVTEKTVDLNALFKRLSRSSLRALGHAEGIQRKMGRGKVHSEQLFAGLYEKDDGELRRVLKSTQLDGDGLLQILDQQARKKLPRPSEYEPVKLDALPSLSGHAQSALIEAQKAADEDKSERINSWHLLYGALAVEDCDLTRKLGERGLVKGKVRRGAAVRGEAPGAARPNIAGFTSDDPRKGTDHFDITREVKALCSVLAAKSVDPPLSLGLFGDWGSGKSFFMGQMEKEFNRLKKQARADKKSPYCPNIVQLWFNAWHYMDMNLWASLASEIFEGLAQELARDEQLDVGQTDPATARARLLAATASKKDVLADAERRKTVAETELKASEEHLTRLKEADAELEDDLSWQAISRAAYRFVANQPEVRANIERAGAALNMSHAQTAATETKAELLELKGLWGRAKALYLAIRNAKSRRVWFILLFCLVLVLVATPLVLHYKDQLAGLPGVISTFVIGLGGLALTVKPYLAGVGRAFKIIEEARVENDALINQKRDEQQQKLERQQTQVRAKLQDATQRVQEASEEVRQLEQQLDELRADRQMANFIRQRHESSDYVNQLGTIARARNDFEQLSNLLAKVKEQALAEAAAVEGQPADGNANEAATNGKPLEENLLLPRIDRIVLYIDDLDRCPENNVVDVLQAVHLLLAFPLFVVVVGVDPRWLLHSLKQHAKVFEGGEADGNGATDEEQRHWQSTPLNYLEKIFQIPFTLRPMAYTGFGNFIEDLARVHDESGPPPSENGTNIPPPPVKTPEGKTEQREPATVIAGNEREPVTPPPPVAMAEVRVETPPGETPIRPALSSTPKTIVESATADESTTGATEAKSDSKTTVDVPVESQPEPLRIEDWERECMKELFWLIPSPRAAKRFVNIYRLLRASVPEEKRAAFISDTASGQYRVALLLLAILTGYPTEAADILRALLTEQRSLGWWQFVASFEKRVQTKAANPINGQNSLSEAEVENFRQLFLNLQRVREVIPDDQSCADFIDWAPQVARYSFQSGRVLLSRRDDENGDDD